MLNFSNICTRLGVLFCILVTISCTRNRVVSSARSQPIEKKWVVIIDPGHGGDDFGTKTVHKPFVYEKNLTMQTAKIVHKKLLELGYDVRLTRNRDVFIPLLKRVEVANFLHADLFVSIHYNSAPNKNASGIEVFYYRDIKNKVRMWRSAQLASIIHDNLIIATKARNRGVKAGDFAVIRETRMPAVLIEAGFLSNRAEADKLRKRQYVEDLGVSIAHGIHTYVQSRKYPRSKK